MIRLDRITFNLEVMGGKPCIWEMRVMNFSPDGVLLLTRKEIVLMP